MARLPKRNAEYFPHPSGWRNDPRIKSLRRKFDHPGYSIYMMLRELIAASNYFHLRIDSDALEDVSGDIIAEPEFVQEITRYCVQRDLFQQIEIDQRTYLTDRELVLSLSELLRKRGISADDIVAGKYRTAVVSASEIHESANNRVGNTQSKVKESKENESVVHAHSADSSKTSTHETNQDVNHIGRNDTLQAHVSSSTKIEGEEKPTILTKVSANPVHAGTHLERLKQSPQQLEGFVRMARSCKAVPPDEELEESTKRVIAIAENYWPEFIATYSGESYQKFSFKLMDHIKAIPEQKSGTASGPTYKRPERPRAV